jgi:hypothetical protein
VKNGGGAIRTIRFQTYAEVLYAGLQLFGETTVEGWTIDVPWGRLASERKMRSDSTRQARRLRHVRRKLIIT